MIPKKTIKASYQFLTEREQIFPSLMKVEFSSFKMLVMMNAANLLQLVMEHVPQDFTDTAQEQRIANKQSSRDHYNGALRTLAEHCKWADHGYLNALQSQAEIIYAFLEEFVAAKGMFNIEKEEILLVTKALSRYQEFKETLCKAEQATKGEHWGSATPFYQAKWDELNEEALKIFE